jgi:hypothetical protein
MLEEDLNYGIDWLFTDGTHTDNCAPVWKSRPLLLCSNSKRFDVFTVVKMSMLVFWVITPCGLVGSYQIWKNILPRSCHTINVISRLSVV